MLGTAERASLTLANNKRIGMAKSNCVILIAMFLQLAIQYKYSGMGVWTVSNGWYCALTNIGDR